MSEGILVRSSIRAIVSPDERRVPVIFHGVVRAPRQQARNGTPPIAMYNVRCQDDDVLLTGEWLPLDSWVKLQRESVPIKSTESLVR